MFFCTSPPVPGFWLFPLSCCVVVLASWSAPMKSPSETPASRIRLVARVTDGFGAWSPSTRTGGQGQLPLFVLDDVG